MSQTERVSRREIPARVGKTTKYERNARRMDAAFARAAREDAELRRLKASGTPWACLDFRPELIGSEPVADVASDTGAPLDTKE
jgi:hypothetical protein